jgi:hypothetical protein
VGGGVVYQLISFGGKYEKGKRKKAKCNITKRHDKKMK